VHQEIILRIEKQELTLLKQLDHLRILQLRAQRGDLILLSQNFCYSEGMVQCVKEFLPLTHLLASISRNKQQNGKGM
jgi:hypothetical protein